MMRVRVAINSQSTRSWGDHTMCHCGGVDVGIAVGVAVGVAEIGPLIPTCVIPTAPCIGGSLEQDQTPTVNARASEKMAISKMQSRALARINPLASTGSRETGAENSTGGGFMNSASSSRSA